MYSYDSFIERMVRIPNKPEQASQVPWSVPTTVINKVIKLDRDFDRDNLSEKNFKATTKIGHHHSALMPFKDTVVLDTVTRRGGTRATETFSVVLLLGTWEHVCIAESQRRENLDCRIV